MDIERKRSFIIQFVYYLILTAIFLLLVKYALPLLAPFVAAVVIACILRRPTRSLVKKFSLPHKPVALLMVLLFYCTVGLLIVLMVIKLYSLARDFIMALPAIYTSTVEPAINEAFLNMENLALQMDPELFSIIQGFNDQFMSWLASLISSLSGWAVGTASNIATSIPGLFIKLVLMVISTFFIAADFNILRDFCMRQLGEKGTALFIQIKEYVLGTLLVCIRAYAIIVTLTFIELSIGLSILKIKHAMIVAACIAVFDILPVLGTGGIMVPWAVISLLQGRFTLALGLLLVYVIITVIRNIVEPKIVGSQLGLHPVVTLASMFAGVQLLGVVGLFGFPIGLSLLRYLNDNGSIHVFKD